MVELDPENVRYRRTFAWFLRMVQNSKFRDKDRALQQAQKALELAPNDANTHYLLAAFTNSEQAMVHAEKAIQLDPLNSQSFYFRGRNYEAKKQYQHALADFDRSIELTPTAWAHVARGKIYKQLQQFEKALAAYKAAEKVDPNNAELYEARGYLYLDQKQYQKALIELEKVFALAPFRSWPYKRRAVAHFHLGNFDKALADIAKALELNPDDPSALTWITPSLVAKCPDQTFRDGMLELVDKTHKLSSNPAGVHAYRARLFSGMGEFARAETEFSKAIELKPRNASHWNQRGLSYGRRGIEDKAHADYSKAIELDPKNWAYRYNRGIANLQLGRLDESLIDFSKALELNPDNTTLMYWNALGSLYLGDQKGYRQICATMVEKESPQWTTWTCALAPASVNDYAVPIVLAEKAASGDPQNPMPVQNLGAILFRAGKVKDAIAQLTKAEQMIAEQISKEPAKIRTSPAYNWFLLSMAHHQAGHVTEGRTYLSKAIDRTETELNNVKIPARWNRRLTLQLFRKEAETLINGQIRSTSTNNTNEPAIAPKPK